MEIEKLNFIFSEIWIMNQRRLSFDHFLQSKFSESVAGRKFFFVEFQIYNYLSHFKNNWGEFDTQNMGLKSRLIFNDKLKKPVVLPKKNRC